MIEWDPDHFSYAKYDVDIIAYAYHVHSLMRNSPPIPPELREQLKDLQPFGSADRQEKNTEKQVRAALQELIDNHVRPIGMLRGTIHDVQWKRGLLQSAKKPYEIYEILD